ncbi:hypothetical protein L5515_010111 [Caenorhabditis briggsae]|uniref:F-box domain-containing protein n=1 Tax=Caenorhabditis briggsae TaxID=6238 RepID=A0AAE9EL96_CAEBR|nr:hypothetical protein L5515_010111 [Caenorhabditis briggsae]
MEEILTPIGGGYIFPENVVGKILEHSDYKSIMTLLKVSKGFRNTIGFQKPDIKLESVEISVEIGSIILALKYSEDSEILRIQYRERRCYYRQPPRKWKRSLGKFWKKEHRKEKRERLEKKFQGKGCFVKNLNSKNKEKFLKTNFLQAFLFDYYYVLCFQSSKISNFKINFPTDLSLKKFSYPIFNCFQFRQRVHLKIQNFCCNFLEDRHISMILECFDLDSIEKLEIFKKFLPDYSKIGKYLIQRTPQWKKLREINCGDESIYDGFVKDLLHFERVHVRMELVTLSEIEILKNAFQTTANPKNVCFELLYFDSNMLRRLFREPLDHENQNSCSWFFEIPNSQQFLKISLDSSKKSINFKRLESSEILEKFPNALEFSKRVERHFASNLQNLTLFSMNLRETFKNHLHKIHLSLNKTNANLTFKFFDDYTYMSYFYNDKGLGCEIYSKNTKERKLMDTLDFVSALCKDLEEILSLQIQNFLHFGVFLHYESTDTNNWNESQEVVSRSFLEKFESILKSRNRFLKINSFHMNPNSQHQLLSFLPFFDLNILTLERLHRNAIPFETNRIVKSDQWRKLKMLYTENYILNVAMEDLMHFEFADVTVEDIGSRDVLNLKEMLQNSSKPSRLTLRYNYFSGPVEPYECLGRRKTASFKSGIITQEWAFPIFKKEEEPENSESSRKTKILTIYHKSNKEFKFGLRDASSREKMAKVSDVDGMVLWTFAFPWIMEKTLEYGDFESILVLRKVSRDIRNFIDDPKNRFHLKPVKIYIQFCQNVIALNFGYTGKGFSAIYAPIEKIKDGPIDQKEGCKVFRYKNEAEKRRDLEYGLRAEINNHTRSKFLEGADSVPTAFKDVETILNLVKSKLKSLWIVLKEPSENSNFSKLFKDFLTSRKSSISVEHFKMVINQEEDVLEILPFLNPKFLKSIEVSNVNYKEGEDVTDRMDINRIGDLEQWKSAEELKIAGFMINNTDLDKLTHFSELEVFVNLITIENLLALKRICTQSIKTFSLKYEELEQDSLRDTFGAPFLQTAPDNSRQRIWYFRIPGNSEDVVTLVIVLTKSSVTFDRISISEKPENVLILN